MNYVSRCEISMFGYKHANRQETTLHPYPKDREFKTEFHPVVCRDKWMPGAHSSEAPLVHSLHRTPIVCFSIQYFRFLAYFHIENQWMPGVTNPFTLHFLRATGSIYSTVAFVTVAEPCYEWSWRSNRGYNLIKINTSWLWQERGTRDHVLNMRNISSMIK